MKTEELKSKIKSILTKKYGLNVFACVKENGELTLHKFLINDRLKDDIKLMINSTVEKTFISENCELKSADNIADKSQALYEIVQNKNFYPFKFINNYANVSDVYSEKEQGNLYGLFFKLNFNDNEIWFYQHIYQVRMIKRSKSLYAMLTNTTYVPLDRDILKIDSRLDILIINKSIITSNIDLLQRSFGFENYIHNEASKTIQMINDLDIVSDISKVIEFGNHKNLTNAKKLLKSKQSQVLKMEKGQLINSLKKHDRYKTMFNFKNDRIIIKTQQNIKNLINMLNDNIVRSELTNLEYDSLNKNILKPLN